MADTGRRRCHPDRTPAVRHRTPLAAVAGTPGEVAWQDRSRSVPEAVDRRSPRRARDV